MSVTCLSMKDLKKEVEEKRRRESPNAPSFDEKNVQALVDSVVAAARTGMEKYEGDVIVQIPREYSSDDVKEAKRILEDVGGYKLFLGLTYWTVNLR